MVSGRMMMIRACPLSSAKIPSDDSKSLKTQAFERGGRSRGTTNIFFCVTGVFQSRIVGCFPTLNLLEQRLSLELYRQLAEGQPVPRMTPAERLGTSVETVNLSSAAGLVSSLMRSGGLSAIGVCQSPQLTAAPTR